ncbi:histone H3 [Astathelohania contejeani]|uniref:Histone H3 n=1 Tax=Astathelohania contejeani TaxID=164912 RepID=A0ABQ7I2I9_9MICR|nr:histone H3 [Thelohania contejeani]
MARTAYTIGNRSTKKPKPPASKSTRSKTIKESPPKNTARKKSLSVKAPIIKQAPVARKPRPHQRVVKEIEYFKRTTNCLIARAPFIRMVRGIVYELQKEMGTVPTRFTKSAISALQDSYEEFLVSLCEYAYHCTTHAKRVTLFPSDLKLARFLRNS